MGSPVRMAALPCLSLILLFWSQGPGVRGQEFQFGPCQVEGVVLQELWEAFQAMKDIVQAQDNITSVQLLRKEVLQNVSMIAASTVLILPCMAREWFIQHWGGQRPWLRNDPTPPQEAESCYLIHALLEFYLNTVFKNYRDKAVEFGILKSFSTLANNFIVIVSKLQPSQEKEMFSISESAYRRFLLFQRAFKQLDREAAVTKAFGEVDILLTWMENFYQV
ncbi:interleukin-24 isoform X2 [Phocoena sinus]|uniref:Interleukin 24 n=1 Tax=Phocoena sinus TaxID=42100 RepID=A0A8C9CJG0_PHOSS|nr:interleukin-24 isoform X2 [Phocoena sinus]